MTACPFCDGDDETQGRRGGECLSQDGLRGVRAGDALNLLVSLLKELEAMCHQGFVPTFLGRDIGHDLPGDEQLCDLRIVGVRKLLHMISFPAPASLVLVGGLRR